MSLRNSLSRNNYSHSGFQQIPDVRAGGNPGDVSIPMEPVRSFSKASKASGSRRPGDRSPAAPSLIASYSNEKPGHSSRPGTHRRNTSQSGDDVLTMMGMIYDKIKNFSIVTRYLLYVIPVGLILCVPIIILSLPDVAKYPWKDSQGETQHSPIYWGGARPLWVFVWIEIFWILLWASKLGAKAAPAIFQFLCGIVSPGVRKYKSVLKRLEIPISLVIWFATGIVTFINVIAIDAVESAPPHSPTNMYSDIAWAKTFNKVLLAFLISSAVLLGEQFIVQLISISYHHTQYEAKIKTSKHNVDIITILYEASCSLFPAYCPEFAEEDYIINDSLELPKGSQRKGHKKSGSATPMRLIRDVGRFGDRVTAVFGNIATEVTGKQVFNPMASHSIVIEALEKRRSCEALARRIWMSLVMEGREALYLEDVQEVLADHAIVSPDDIFAALDRDGNGDVSLDEMIMTITEFGRERKAVAHSLHDVDQAIKVLDRLLIFLVLLIDIFIFILILSPSLTASLAGVGTSLLSLSFVFAVTTQEILGSCIFLFVKHPYDVGDRVEINTQPLMVERISLLYTVFKCINSGKLSQSPNIVLNTLWVDNISRSNAMKEQLFCNVDFATTIEDVELLRQEMQKFVLEKDNSRDFQPEIIVEVTGLNNMASMELKVEIRHKSNWHNETLRAARRSKFMCALILAMRRVPISGPGGSDAVLGTADKPSWSVAIPPDVAKTARQTFLDNKQAARLVNQKKDDDDASTSGHDANFLSPMSSVRNRKASTSTSNAPPLPKSAETAAMTELNARAPAYEYDDGSGNGRAGSSPGRPALDDSKSPVHADSNRQRELNDLYSELQKSPSMGKRRTNYKLNVTTASPTTPATPVPNVHDRMLEPSTDGSPTETDYPHEQHPGFPPRSDSSAQQGYSPLGRGNEGFYHQNTWGTGSFMENQSPASPRPPAPSTGRYVTPPAKAEDTTYKGKMGSTEESWFDRDSATYTDDHVQAPPRDSRGPPSARASSLALGSLPEEVDVSTMPVESLPRTSQMHSDTASSRAVSRGKSTKSDKSWARGDEQQFRLSQGKF